MISSAPRRVVVTGMGVVSGLASGREEFWSGLAAGHSAIRPLSGFAAGDFHFSTAAQAQNFDPLPALGTKLVRETDRFAQFALVAAREAYADARLDPNFYDPARCSVVCGTSIGGQDTQDDGFTSLYREGRQRLHPGTIVKIMPNAGTSQIAILFGMMGPSYTISVACSSSNCAIGQAFWMVRGGMADIALAGGSEAPFSFGNLKAWDAMRVVSPTECRPFDANRDGLTLGEGGGILVLESLHSAQARGAHIYAELAGFGMTSDAAHLVQPSSEGAARAMAAAMADGEIEYNQVDYINAHGTGTIANDSSEAAAIRSLFGDGTATIPVSSTKSMHGHALGAAGALEAIATVFAIERNLIPPTANHRAADAGCGLDVVAGEARPARIDVALSNSFAFGGINAVLAFRRFKP